MGSRNRTKRLLHCGDGKLQVKEGIHVLFSYGTLQLEKVQLDNDGRNLKGVKDRLCEYELDKLHIKDAVVLSKSQLEYHNILEVFKS